MNTRSRVRQPPVPSDDDDDDDGPTSAWLERASGATALLTPQRDDQSIMSFHMEKKRKSPPHQPQRDEPEPTNSADDDEDEEEFELASQRTVKKPTLSAPPPPPATKHVQFAEPLSQTYIIDEQRTRRSNARNTLEALRNNQIPGYDTRVPASERDVVIDPELFRSLREDSAFEFQEANKPPWAPSVPQAILNKERDWEVMETLSELDKRRNDWYQLALKVAGALQQPPDAIVVMGASTASTQAVRPSRTIGSETVTPPANAGTTRNVGLATVGETLAALTATTPLRDETVGPPGPTENSIGAAFERYRQRRERNPPPPPPLAQVPQPGPDPTSRLFPVQPRRPATEPRTEAKDAGINEYGTQFDDAAPPLSPPRQAPAPRPAAPGEPLLNPQSEGQIDDALLFATQNALGGVEMARSGARFADFRAARRVVAPWYERDRSSQAAAINQTVRAEGARARSWISRPLATGVFFFNQSYLSARNKAYTQITSRADHLASVSMHHFARPGRSGTVQFRVFDSFGELIAEMYRLARHNSNNSAKLASDAANIAGAIEQLTQLFVTRITFDRRTCEFHDTGVTGALQRYGPPERRRFGSQTAQQRVSELIVAYGLDDTRTNPLLLTTHPKVDPRYVPGTLIGAMHQE